MMKIPLKLIKQLSQQIDQLYQRYEQQLDKKIFAQFDRTLFSENFAHLSLYLQEIRQTLNQLKTLEQNEINKAAFLAEKLIAQCRALTDALENKTKAKSYSKPTPYASSQNKTKQDIHKLPPPQRLEKYYEALQALNSKIDTQVALLYDAQSQQEREHYRQQISITEQRKQRCLDAIALLEEYLNYSNER